MFKTPKTGFKVGILASSVLLFLILVVIFVVGIRSYDGHCISFEPPKRECNMVDFLFPYILILVVYSLIGKPILSIIVLITLLVLPVAGYLIGKINGSKGNE